MKKIPPEAIGVLREASDAIKPRAECRHEVIGFQSGDYYIFCRECPATWVASGVDNMIGDVAAPQNANIGVGCTLSGENRIKEQK